MYDRFVFIIYENDGHLSTRFSRVDQLQAY